VPYSRVVVGTDGSATAETAVKHAGKLAADHGARLVVVTAYEIYDEDASARVRVAADDVSWSVTARHQAEEKAKYGKGLAADVGATHVVAQAAPGDPSDVLLETATEFEADLIVVGSKGLTGASRFVLGSVASAVSHHARCDVLIVQTAD
jgi:nucleotide-binding universal stress UspA family protein